MPFREIPAFIPLLVGNLVAWLSSVSAIFFTWVSHLQGIFALLATACAACASIYTIRLARANLARMKADLPPPAKEVDSD